MTTLAIKYGNSFSRITAPSLCFRTNYQRHFGEAYKYYYPKQLPEGTHLFSPPFYERQYEGSVMPLAKINLWVGDACSVH